MNPGHSNSDRAIRGEQHMDDLCACGRIEHRGEGIDLDERAALDAKPDRCIHPRIHGDHERARECAAERDDHAGTHMCRRSQTIPAVQIEAEEDRFKKKGEAFREKGMPMIGPANAMKVGQSRPSSNDRTVPETAPTAKRMAVPRAQRFARSRYSERRVRSHAISAATIMIGMVMPITAKMMWKPSDSPICQ